MKFRSYILLILFFWTSNLLAQEVKFTAQVSKTTVAVGEQFQVEFAVNGNAGEFMPPVWRGLQVLSGPNQSTSMESINGNTTVSNSVSYILMATSEGEVTIGSASITVNGKKYTTNPIRIKVVKGNPQQQNAARQGASEDDVAQANPAELSKQIFLRVVPDKSNVYQGQQVTVSFRLYTRIGIDDSRVDKIPDLTGFYNEDTKTPQQQQQQQVQWKVETYKGLKYNTADIKQSLLFPEHSGNITIDPFEMTFLVRQPVHSNDPIEQFFGGASRQVKYQAKSLPLVIHVKPLPDAGKPDSFTGAVGTFNIETGVDKNELKANEALNYNVKVTGAGNIKLLKAPNVTFPADFDKYDPKIADTSTQHGAGTRIYTYLLIPRHQGEYTIDPLKFSYFNPATERYVTLTSRGFKIKVNKGVAENNVTALAGSNKQDLKTLGNDIRYIKTGDAGLHKPGEGFFGSIGFYLLLIFGPVACIGAYNYRNKMIKMNSDIVMVKNRRASKVAAKHLANAQKQLQANNTAEFYEDVFKGMYGYLSDKLNIPYANLDRETIASTLKTKLTDEPLVNRVLETLDLCEMARYAPVTHITKQEVFEKAKGIINDIEDKI